MTSPRIPLATYRFQFNRNFTFRQAAELVPYLAELGISHCYASPYLRARPGSMHGYDIIDHHNLNPEIGSPEDYDHFTKALHEHGMGLILDFVPNHMGVMGGDNAWWLDVLENGEASKYADYFDVDWEPLKDELQHKVLIPVLGDQYGTVLDRGELKLTFDCDAGEFGISYFAHRFPVNPTGYPRILGYNIEGLAERLGAQNSDLLELQSLISAFNHLPVRQESEPEKRAERIRDKEIHKRRLAALCARAPEIATFIETNVRHFNGTPGQSGTFEDLHELIKAQAYRLAYWRVAADDINYRRFFDVNDLAALRQENPEVFEETHRYVLQLVSEGKINGLRIDHPDGLYDPAQYFRRLQETQKASEPSANSEDKPLYVVIEKILTGAERLPADWPVYGTTGYDFASLVNALFVHPAAESRMDRCYRAFLGHAVDFDDLVYECKKLVLDRILTSELSVLANSLTRIALASRHTCDFTVKTLRDALTEVAACFPVYRTYVTGDHVSVGDRAYIELAVQRAKSRNTPADASAYDFVRDVLLTRQAEGHIPSYQRNVVHFAMKFQQLTGALMAKGLEDTAFYRYNRLVSLNDVGGDPLRFGVTPEEFHRDVLDKASAWPHRMLSTSTHDSKRSEDVRARIDVLSEIPRAWRQHVRGWRDLNYAAKRKSLEDESPSRNDEYLLYQTLVGAWPFDMDTPDQDFKTRIRDYMLKAVREAKEHTSWVSRNQEYEDAVAEFVNAVLSNNDFVSDFLPFQQRVADYGMLNSLAQNLLKLTVPGIPDIYQGNESWDLSLVDPDNRRPVNYESRRAALKNLQASGHRCIDQNVECVRELLANMRNSHIKLYVTWKALQLRAQHANLFQNGEYIPLNVSGSKAEHSIAFAWSIPGEICIVVVPRFCAQLLSHSGSLPLGVEVWEDTRVDLPFPVDALRNWFTGEAASVERGESSTFLSLGAVLKNFPLTLLVGRSGT